MKHKNLSYLACIIISTIILNGCHFGSTNQDSSSSIKQSQKKPALKVIYPGTFSMLGAPGMKTTKPKDQDMVFVNMAPYESAAFDLANTGVQVIPDQEGSSQLVTYVTAENSSLQNELMAGVKASGGFGLFKASASLDYMNKAQAASGSVSIIQELTISNKAVIMDPQYTEYADYLRKNNPSKFIEEFGNSYQQSVDMKAVYRLTYKLEMDDTSEEAAIKASLDVGYGSFAAISAYLDTRAKSANGTMELKITALRVGGASPLPISTTTCNLKDESLEACSSKVLAEMKPQLQEWENQLIKQINELPKDTPQGYIRFSALNKINGSWVTSIDELDLKLYPGLNAVNKSKLQSKQEDILDAMSKAALLGKNSSFVKSLTNSKILSNSLKDNESFAKIIKNGQMYQAYNDKFFEEDMTQNILSQCFSSSSTLDNCEEYLETEELIPKRQGGIRYPSKTLAEYINEVLNLDTDIGLTGYYSANTETNSNFFWIDITSGQEELMVPLSINEDIDWSNNPELHVSRESELNQIKFLQEKGNPELLKSLSNVVGSSGGVPGLLYWDIDNSDPEIIYPTFLPLPQEFLLKITRNKQGDIASVTPDFTDDKNFFTGIISTTTSLTCTKFDYRLPQKRTTIKMVDCGHSEIKYKPILDAQLFTFQAQPVSLTSIFTNFSKKPITDKGYHIKVHATEVNVDDVGGISLGIKNYWCSPNGLYCFKYSSGTGFYFYKQDKAEFSFPFLGAGAGTMTLSPDMGGFDYLARDNKMSTLKWNEFPSAYFTNNTAPSCKTIAVTDDGKIICKSSATAYLVTTNNVLKCTEKTDLGTLVKCEDSGTMNISPRGIAFDRPAPGARTHAYITNSNKITVFDRELDGRLTNGRPLTMPADLTLSAPTGIYVNTLTAATFLSIVDGVFIYTCSLNSRDGVVRDCSKYKHPRSLKVVNMTFTNSGYFAIIGFENGSVTCDVNTYTGAIVCDPLSEAGYTSVALNRDNSYLYMTDKTGQIHKCNYQAATNRVTGCKDSQSDIDDTNFSTGIAFNIDNSYAYFVNKKTGKVQSCKVTEDDQLTPCKNDVSDAKTEANYGMVIMK